MSAGPLVSVVIPCRNAARWLDETLASVAQQTDARLDVVVVDDGSTDDSAAIARRWGARVEIGPQRGVSAARNAGTALAGGAYVLYLDSDDLLTPGTVAARLARLEQSGADVALTPWTRWESRDDGTFAAGETMRGRLGHRPDVDLLTDKWWPPGAILYRRTIVDRIGAWRTDLPIIQDARFLLDAALCGARFEHLDQVGLRYRVHGNTSLSRQDPAAFVRDCFANAADLHDRWSAIGSLDGERRRGLLYAFGYCARAAFVADRPLFDAALERLYRLDPAYLPDRPVTLRALSRAVGYRRAEHVAALWRQAKALTQRG